MVKIIAGNWKMNGTREMLDTMYAALADIKTENKIIICPPFTLLGGQSPIVIGAQDCSANESGAYTGEVSAKMLFESGAKYVIVGHSERRQYHNESNETVRAKAERALANGLTPIICVGETKEQFESGQTLEIIENQIRESIPNTESDIIVAYEPVWAIGTGLIPTMEDITRVHKHMRTLTPAPLLYGGSVKGSNAAEIMGTENVDGVLVGGASLKPDDFIPIIKSV